MYSSAFKIVLKLNSYTSTDILGFFFDTIGYVTRRLAEVSVGSFGE